MEERIEFSARERQALLEFAGCIDLMVSNAENLDRVLDNVEYGKRDHKMVIAVIKKLFSSMLDVMDTEQLVAFRKNMKGLGVSIGVKNITDDNGTLTGRWLSFKVIEELAKGCHDKCLMCSGTGKEFYDCTLRKALNELPTELHILESETQKKGKCPYSIFA